MSEASNLNLLLKVSQILDSGRGLGGTLTELLREVIASLGAERGFVVLSRDGQLIPVVGYQVELDSAVVGQLFSTKVVEKVLHDHEPLLLLDAMAHNYLQSTSIQQSSIRSILAAPLSWAGRVQGAIYLDNRLSAGVFREVHRDLLAVISHQAARALEAAALYEELQKAHRRSVRSLVDVGELEEMAAPLALENLLGEWEQIDGQTSGSSGIVTSTGHEEDCIVRLFGELRVEGDGRPVPAWKSRKDCELFAFLALHGGRLVHEEQLAEMFWPEASKPRHSLQNAVTQIRKVLGSKELLERRHEGYALSDRVWTDLGAFRVAAATAEAAARREDWDEALRQWQLTDTLVGGQLLEGLQAEWLSPFRREVEREVMDCRTMQADYFARRGKHLLAVDLWKRVLSLDSCHDEAHFRLMEAYLILGRRADAVRTFQQAEEAYRRDLDLEPPERLRQLLSEI